MKRIDFIKNYIYLVNKSSWTPNAFCTVPYLVSRKDIVPYKKYKKLGLRIKGSSNFFLPPYTEKDGEVEFYNDEAEVGFPVLDVETNIGYRYDTEYYYYNTNSVDIATTDRDLRVNMQKDYECRGLPYNDHSLDKELQAFYTRLTTRSIYTTSLEPHFHTFLFNDFGQHRFVLIYKGNICAVLLWSENAMFITVHYMFGISPPTSKKTAIAESRKEQFFYASRIIFIEFCKRLPLGTVINAGGPSYDARQKYMRENTFPCNIIEIKGCVPRVAPIYKGKVCELVGKLITEEPKIPINRRTKHNYMLYNSTSNYQCNIDKLSPKLKKFLVSQKNNRIRRRTIAKKRMQEHSYILDTVKVEYTDNGILITSRDGVTRNLCSAP